MIFAVKTASAEPKTFKEDAKKQKKEEEKGLTSPAYSQRSFFKVFSQTLPT
jgi:hypothetical protein